MMRRAIAAAALIGAALGPPALAQQHGGHDAPDARHVSVQFSAYAPRHLDIVAGETVRWTNDSVRQHTVTADDGSFDSLRLLAGAEFHHKFSTPGAIPYHCSLHAGITGSVQVHTLLLDAPEGAAAAGRPFPLAGRAALPPGTPVAIEADDGAGFARVGTAEVGSDGRFATRVVPTGTARYRATVAGAASPGVQVLVLDRRVGVSALRTRGRIALRASVTPASPGARVVLQLKLRDRFGWWPVRSRRLDHHSRAFLRLRYPRRVAARIVLTLDDGATPLAISRTIRVGG